MVRTFSAALVTIAALQAAVPSLGAPILLDIDPKAVGQEIVSDAALRLAGDVISTINNVFGRDVEELPSINFLNIIDPTQGDSIHKRAPRVSSGVGTAVGAGVAGGAATSLVTSVINAFKGLFSRELDEPSVAELNNLLETISRAQSNVVQKRATVAGPPRVSSGTGTAIGAGVAGGAASGLVTGIIDVFKGLFSRELDEPSVAELNNLLETISRAQSNAVQKRATVAGAPRVSSGVGTAVGAGVAGGAATGLVTSVIEAFKGLFSRELDDISAENWDEFTRLLLTGSAIDQLD